jgi:hypothetical protein
MALAGALAVAACRAGDPAHSHRPDRAADAVKQVSLGHTTAAGIEQLFGPADQRAEDGALVYRFERARGDADRRRFEVETVTFRFTRGVLSKVCRTRS